MHLLWLVCVGVAQAARHTPSLRVMHYTGLKPNSVVSLQVCIVYVAGICFCFCFCFELRVKCFLRELHM
jgi:hypothetical protein